LHFKIEYQSIPRPSAPSGGGIAYFVSVKKKENRGEEGKKKDPWVVSGIEPWAGDA